MFLASQPPSVRRVARFHKTDETEICLELREQLIAGGALTRLRRAA